MTTIPAAALDAAARAYAADTYRGTRGLDGQTVVWDTLTESDRAACAWKAQVVLTAALPVLAEAERPDVAEARAREAEAEIDRLRAALDIKRAQVARVEALVAQGGDYHWFVVDAPEGEYVQEGSPCVSVDAVRDALEGGERDPDSEAVDALLRQVAADAWDEGYRLDWTGGVKHINPYREGADQ